MLRKIRFPHRGSTCNAEQTEFTDDDDDELNVERPKSTVRATSETSADNLTRTPLGFRQKGPERAISNANSEFVVTEQTTITHPGDQLNELLGLHVICDKPNPSGDIIFVHGLGGTATKTWCWNRHTDYFWPPWLVEEDRLSLYRVSTFGYNSDFKGVGTNLNIIDFAKELLFQILTFSSGDGENNASIGKRPIIFIAHSMGGLVVKKAYILGRHDPKYSSIISSVHGIVFLATPHRGSQFAKILNNILATTPLGAPRKAYIADLDIHSSTLQDINEQFRTLCESLTLVSFFETFKTNLGLTKALIVGKESAILGYPQEDSCALNADHHTICKFKSREDGNYVKVKNLLIHLTDKLHCIRPTLPAKRPTSNYDLVKKIEAILGIRDSPEDELTVIRNKVMEGTCQWILRTNNYLKWIGSILDPQTLETFWLIGLPATGKSTLASVVIDHLQFLHQSCQYHFFSSAHQSKRTAAYCLRSIAYQLALVNEEFRERLFKFHDETELAFTSQNQNFRIIWEKLFVEIIFKMRFEKGLFWVLDAIDEMDPQSQLINSLMKIQPATSVRIFLTSRPIKILTSPIAIGSSMITHFLSENDTGHDIRTYVNNAVCKALPASKEIQEDVISQVLAKASGSFLWVKLAMETLEQNWHTQDDIRKVFTEVPRGMESLYDQMLNRVASQSSRLQLLAKKVLTWAACCWRPLSIAELQTVLEPEFSGFVNLESTVIQVCGHFLTVDNSKVLLIHATARDFLLNSRDGLPPFIDYRNGHNHMAASCLRHLSSDNWSRVFKVVQKSSFVIDKRPKINRLLIAEKDHPFLGYATCYWAYHFSKSSLDSQHLQEILGTFLTKYSLSWIEGIALSGNLRYLTRSAQYLKVYTKRRSRNLHLDALESLNAPAGLKIPAKEDAENVLLWATDFVRIVGKFGPNLVQCPSSIHRLVPPFCPHDSVVGRVYGSARETGLISNNKLSVRGLPSAQWDDCLATVIVGEAAIASKVLATDAYLLTLISSIGNIIIWYVDTFDRARELHHREYVPHMVLNRSSTLVATSGTKTYRVWDIASGKEMYRLPKTTEALSMAISFGNAESELVIGLDDCSITCYNLETSQVKWQFLAKSPAHGFHGCPRIMTFSPDVSKVAMAWRGKPPYIFDIALAQCQNIQKHRVSSVADAICAPEKIQWQVDGNSILILCQNTQLVEWHLHEETQILFDHVKPREMAISQDGNFLLTSDNMGTISIWTFPRLSLVYQLLNDNEFIRDLVFSPDSRRFYDVRGSMCKAWEPDALIRADEQDLEDHSSIGESCAMTEPIISRDESSQCHVTALATDTADEYFCCGKEDGSVNIYEAFGGKRVRKVYSHASTSSVLALAWSNSGRYVVSSDDSGRIIAKRLEPKESGKWAVFPVFDFRIAESVEQFLFSDSEKLVLLSTASQDCVWDLKSKRELASKQWISRQSRRWTSHPLNTNLLIWIAPGEVHTYDWTTLQHSETEHVLHKNLMLASSPTKCLYGSHVSWVALTSSAQYIVYLTRSSASFPSLSSRPHLEFLSTSSLRHQHPHNLTPDCASDLAGKMKCLVGTYKDHIVFLDYDYWLCTWRIDTSMMDVKRHFFLPRDWLNTGTLEMATVNAEGTFLCPKMGNVAIVRGGIQL